MVSDSDEKSERKEIYLACVDKIRKNLRIHVNISGQIRHQFGIYLRFNCSTICRDRQSRLFDFCRQQFSWIAMILMSSYRAHGQLLRFSTIRIGALAFFIVSCSPTRNIEPDLAPPTEIPIQPAVSFSTLKPISPDQTRPPGEPETTP